MKSQGFRTISADLGGSRVKLAVVEDGAVIENDVFPVPEGGISATLAMLEERMSAMKSRHPGEWVGIGLALPGIVDEDSGRVLSSNAKNEGVEKVDLVKWGREKMSLPCRVINDARAAFIGELNYGCAKGETNAVMLVMGTGIGTSAVCQGVIERGVHGTAGLLGGHFPIQFMNGRPCNCGGAGCMEAYVGTWALKEMAGDPSYDYKRLAEDYGKGDEKARELFKVVSTALGAGTLALVHLMTPKQWFSPAASHTSVLCWRLPKSMSGNTHGLHGGRCASWCLRNQRIPPFLACMRFLRKGR